MTGERYNAAMKSDGYSFDAVPVAECTPCHIGRIVDCASDGTIAAHREYDPFGGTVFVSTSPFVYCFDRHGSP